ncbi:Zinc finger protein ZAT11 [Heracleum sosnowskyi]|uniref:Zinc finger protein ZAT11 n=1 Tax=Heracleum sosnowskyi TaxID=360622 RepID=A0AAD8MHK0_9APIA|nr:Zinc finger protein ZAT11 [Heracleum sosnowskyi]
MAMKRSRDNEQGEVDMAKWLNLLSEIGKSDTLPNERIFECKTCNRQFTSFQALGGHCASHKRPKLMTGEVLKHVVAVKPKAHECSICGVEFALGQALGGHMRRHRAEMEANSSTIFISRQTVVKSVPVLKETNSSCKRAWGLDLNLMPYDNYLKLGW